MAWVVSDLMLVLMAGAVVSATAAPPSGKGCEEDGWRAALQVFAPELLAMVKLSASRADTWQEEGCATCLRTNNQEGGVQSWSGVGQGALVQLLSTAAPAGSLEAARGAPPRGSDDAGWGRARTRPWRGFGATGAAPAHGSGGAPACQGPARCAPAVEWAARAGRAALHALFATAGFVPRHAPAPAFLCFPAHALVAAASLLLNAHGDALFLLLAGKAFAALRAACMAISILATKAERAHRRPAAARAGAGARLRWASPITCPRVDAPRSAAQAAAAAAAAAAHAAWVLHDAACGLGGACGAGCECTRVASGAGLIITYQAAQLACATLGYARLVGPCAAARCWSAIRRSASALAAAATRRLGVRAAAPCAAAALMRRALGAAAEPGCKMQDSNHHPLASSPAPTPASSPTSSPAPTPASSPAHRTATCGRSAARSKQPHMRREEQRERPTQPADAQQVKPQTCHPSSVMQVAHSSAGDLPAVAASNEQQRPDFELTTTVAAAAAAIAAADANEELCQQAFDGSSAPHSRKHSCGSLNCPQTASHEEDNAAHAPGNAAATAAPAAAGGEPGARRRAHRGRRGSGRGGGDCGGGCVICWEAAPLRAAVHGDCSHLCLCERCYADNAGHAALERCPVCQLAVQLWVKVHGP